MLHSLITTAAKVLRHSRFTSSFQPDPAAQSHPCSEALPVSQKPNRIERMKELMLENALKSVEMAMNRRTACSRPRSSAARDLQCVKLNIYASRRRLMLA